MIFYLSLWFPEAVRACMEAGLDSLKWSVNAADREQFEKIMGVSGKLFGNALENMSDAYKRYLEGVFRNEFGLVGTSAGLSAYSASKGGLVNLTRHLAAEWARGGVRVNALAPGYFESEMTQDLFTDERLHAWATRQTPMRRTGREGELDGALLYLASDASSFVTGSVLAVDGGWTAV